MLKARNNLIAVLLFTNAMAFGLAAWVYGSKAASAQGTRKFTPEGFEFPVTTPVLKYHFPREKYKAAVFKGTWIAENAEEIRPNYEIDSAEARITPSQPVVFFNLNKPNNDWPKGLYRLEIRADGALVHTERFVIR